MFNFMCERGVRPQSSHNALLPQRSPADSFRKGQRNRRTRVSVTHREQLDRIGQNVVKNIVTKATRKGFSSTDSFSIQSGGGGGAAALDRMGGSSSPRNGPQDPVWYQFSSVFSLRLFGPTHQDPEGEPVQPVQKYCNRSEFWSTSVHQSICWTIGPSEPHGTFESHPLNL